MPGKVNPVIPEAVSQVVAQVYGNDAVVAFAGSQGNFELNVYLPVIARNLLESIRLLSNVSRLFADRCIAGLEADVERCRTYAEATPQAATALNPLLGYERVAELVKESAKTGKSIRTLVLEHGLMPEAEVDAALDLLKLTEAAFRTPDQASGWRPSAKGQPQGVVRSDSHVDPGLHHERWRIVHLSRWRRCPRRGWGPRPRGSVAPTSCCSWPASRRRHATPSGPSPRRRRRHGGRPGCGGTRGAR